MKFIVKGTMKELPAPYAPGNYHHPLPTLACTMKCIKECLPGVRGIEMWDKLEGSKKIHNAVSLSVQIKHIYQGSGVNPFLQALVDIIKRHLPESHGKVDLHLDFYPPIGITATEKPVT